MGQSDVQHLPANPVLQKEVNVGKWEYALALFIHIHQLFLTIQRQTHTHHVGQGNGQ